MYPIFFTDPVSKIMHFHILLIKKIQENCAQIHLHG